MNKITKYLLVVFLTIFSGISNIAQSQTYYLSETLTTQASFNKFTALSIKGAEVWYFNSQNPQYGAVMSGFSNSTSHENEDWLISPAMNLQNVTNLKLTFDHTRGPESEMNVGMDEGWYKVFATANYTGNVSTTQWIEITGVKHATVKWVFVNSGVLNIPEVTKSANTRIAFKYLSSNSKSATWEVKNVSVFGTPVQIADFKVTTWNVEWLSCLTNGPSDRELQINNVVKVIKTINSDIVALQEVGTSNIYQTIDTLVKRLGSNIWEGKIVTWKEGNCEQNQGIVYKKSKIIFVNASLITNSGNWSYWWSNGRVPVLYNVNFVVGNKQIPISLINIHAKAHYSEPQEDYNRRYNASIGLKNLLDGSAYNTKRVIVIGDFNDKLIGTICGTCSSTLSPYKNFMDDENNYKGVTSIFNTVDNVIISNELFTSYTDARIENLVPIVGNNWTLTTSTHLPTTVSFSITETVSIEDFPTSLSFQVFPNPAKRIVYVKTESEIVPDLKLYSIDGRLLQNIRSTEIDISSYAAGMYFLRVENEVVKIVKQ